jgi:hypothetical protein
MPQNEHAHGKTPSRSKPPISKPMACFIVRVRRGCRLSVAVAIETKTRTAQSGKCGCQLPFVIEKKIPLRPDARGTLFSHSTFTPSFALRPPAGFPRFRPQLPCLCEAERHANRSRNFALALPTCPLIPCAFQKSFFRSPPNLSPALACARLIVRFGWACATRIQ